VSVVTRAKRRDNAWRCLGVPICVPTDTCRRAVHRSGQIAPAVGPAGGGAEVPGPAVLHTVTGSRHSGAMTGDEVIQEAALDGFVFA
jgi:hypothetical protein